MRYVLGVLSYVSLVFIFQYLGLTFLSGLMGLIMLGFIPVSILSSSSKEPPIYNGFEFWK